jgi:penicillin-binding protein 1C
VNTRRSSRWRTLILAAAVSLVLIAALVVLRMVPAAPLSQTVPSSRQVRAADGSLLRLTLAADGQYRLWTPLEGIAANTIEAILLKEDRYFYQHPGINLPALARAAWMTYALGNRQGASTLTMQLARRLYQLNTRRIPGKLQQLLLALWLEARYSKDDLLEAYVNLAPMGGNIEGVAAAARIYFGREADQLTVAESLALAVMPQNPSRRARFGANQQQARRRLAAQWRNVHPADATIAAMGELPLSGRSRDNLPFLAPHLTDQLLRSTVLNTVIDTTLEPTLQRLLERLIRQYVDEHRSQGILNGAALLVDRRDLSVKALVGSADYWDTAIQGQVNGVLAKRSPGSTLKPFLYGLAIDQGLIHPLSVLNDAPTAFGPFQPENFDGHFIGPVAARDALIRSRNVPAVSLANQLQRPTLHDFLRSAGVTGLRSESHYGLSLVLGGGELTMEELVGLYAMLANDGLLKPLRYRQTDPEAVGIPLLSPQAAFLVKDMLRANPRPKGRSAGMHNRHWRTAWKTGTSWGFRDAWSIGLTGEYILAVWIGNFNARPNPAFVGIQAAAPLFFRIVDALELTLPAETPQPDRVPPGLIRVDVCAASGELPNRWCPQTAATWFIPGKSPIRVSTLHRPVMVDRITGKAACPPYDPATTQQEIFAFWPSDIERLFRAAGLPRRTPPAQPAACPQAIGPAVAADAPRLLSPLTNVVYTLRLSRSAETIDLQASIGGDAEVCYWFADNRYLGRNPRGGQLSWRPDHSGRYDLTVVDDQGRSTSRTLAVEFVP